MHKTKASTAARSGLELLRRKGILSLVQSPLGMARRAEISNRQQPRFKPAKIRAKELKARLPPHEDTYAYLQNSYYWILCLVCTSWMQRFWTKPCRFGGEYPHRNCRHGA